MPAIPLIATLAVSAITGIIALLATVNYRLKYGSADQRIKEMEKQRIALTQDLDKLGAEKGSLEKIQDGLSGASLGLGNQAAKAASSSEKLSSLEKTQRTPEVSSQVEKLAAESDSQKVEEQSLRP